MKTTRRTFIQQAGMLASAVLLTPANLFKEHYKMGLQLYTIRDAMAADVKGTLKKIAAYGYEEVEIYGYADKKYYGMAPADFLKLLTDNNLTTSSGHYNLDKYVINNATADDLNRYVDDCIERATALKQNYIVWPWLDPQLRTLEKFKVVAETLNKIGERLSKAHLQLAYHNHDFEFIDWNGQNGYDIILNQTDPSLVKLELDLFWAVFSKQNLHDLFTKQPGRFHLWHIKDMNKTNRDLHEVVGDGSIDFKSILADGKLAGLKHIFIEQGNNYTPDAMSCVERSAKYVKKELL